MGSTSKTIVLITGGNTGLGYEMVKKLSSDHPETHQILMGTRSLSKGEEAHKALGSPTNVTPVQLDVTSDTSIDALVSTISSQHGKLDILINNAGTAGRDLGETGPGSFHSEGKSLREVYTHVFSTNTISSAVVTEKLIPLLSLSDLPKIIFVSSLLGSISSMSAKEKEVSPLPWYSSSKTALNYLMAYYAMRYGPKGWKVNAACPGLNATAINGVPLSEKTDPRNGAVRKEGR
ncbi:hypothetical protein G7Y89_g7683 [Cudoniella acicularis]|uniref:NAD(P)-binding protein n=1 Tax=Cudoniella acicularis TaxID=354080 RepID=A0A8H4RLK8_9HELO|nr:hypothetical protein G7Y89_g7683 [Cudoniella acicularis]